MSWYSLSGCVSVSVSRSAACTVCTKTRSRIRAGLDWTGRLTRVENDFVVGSEFTCHGLPEGLEVISRADDIPRAIIVSASRNKPSRPGMGSHYRP